MITLRVLSRRAWTREAITQFTTTISYHGPSHYVTTDGGVPIEFAEKASAEGTGRNLKLDSAVQASAGAPSPMDLNISELPV